MAKHGAKVRSLKLQILSTVAVVFVSFMLRAAFSATNAITSFAPLNSTCGNRFLRARACARARIPVCPSTRMRVRVFVHPCITFCCSTTAGNCDPSCQPEGVIVNVWLFYTPELQLTVVFLSSPVTLLVALWGMTSSQARSMMKIGGSGGGGAAKKLLDRILQPAHDGDMTMQAALRPGIDADTH